MAHSDEKGGKLIELRPGDLGPTVNLSNHQLFERLARYYHELKTLTPEQLDENPYSQSNTWNETVRHWNKLDPHQQSTLRTLAFETIPYLKASTDPKGVWDQVLGLARVSRHPVEDVNRICKVRDLSELPWIQIPGEEVYDKGVNGWLKDFLRAFRWTQAHAGMLFWSGVVCLSSACKWNYYIDRRAFKLRMQWYIWLSGDSSSGKSQAYSAATEILQRLNDLTWESGRDTDYRKVRILAEDITKAGMYKAMAPLIDRAQHHDPITGNVTFEDIPVGSSSVLLLDELATFMGSTAHEVEAKIPFMTEIAEKGYLKKHTAKDGLIHLQDCCLNMLACCAPAWIQGAAISPMFAQSGFLDRTLIVHRGVNEERRFPTPEAVDPLLAIDLAKRLLPFSSQLEPVELATTRECERYYENWYHSLPVHATDFDDPTMHVTTPNRQANQAWKLAGILCLSENGKWIEERHLEKSIELLSIEREQIQRFYTAIVRNPVMERSTLLVRMIARNGGELFQGDLRKRSLMSARFKGDRMEFVEALGHLTELGWARSRKYKNSFIYSLTDAGWIEAGKQGYPIPDNIPLDPKDPSLRPLRLVREQVARDLAIAAGEAPPEPVEPEEPDPAA